MEALSRRYSDERHHCNAPIERGLDSEKGNSYSHVEYHKIRFI